MSSKEKSGANGKCKHFTACGLEELLISVVFNFLLKIGYDVSSTKVSGSYLLSRKDIFHCCQVTAVHCCLLQLP